MTRLQHPNQMKQMMVVFFWTTQLSTHGVLQCSSGLELAA